MERLAQHSSTWNGLGRARKGTCASVFTRHTSTCVWLCERGVAQYKQQTVTFECADCPLVRQRTGDMYVAEKDDLMIDQLLMLPLFTSPSALSLSFVLFYPPTSFRPRYLVRTLFNKINIAHMATYCPLAAGSYKKIHSAAFIYQ